MKTIKEFKVALEPLMEDLETYRLSELGETKKAQFYYAIPAILVIIAIPIYWNVNPIMAFVIVGIAIAIGYYIATEIVSRSAENFDWKFKDKALSTFVKALYPQASYSAGKKMPLNTFLGSELFSMAEEYEGEDYFSGTTEKGFKFQFSEVDVWIAPNRADKNALFEGFFFEIETPHNFQTRVLVLPKQGRKSRKTANKMDQLSLKGLTADGEMLEIEHINPKFEKDFVVYSHSQEMAFHLLTPNIIEGICAIRKRWKCKPKLSFIDNKIYVALDADKEFFRTNLHNSLLEGNILDSIYEDLTFCFEVVEYLGQPIETTFKEATKSKKPKPTRKSPQTIELDASPQEELLLDKTSPSDKTE